jgi:hypothetical protein
MITRSSELGSLECNVTARESVEHVHSMITRRSALLAAFGFPAVLRPLQGASKPFWEERDPKDWTPAEVEEMLTHSPWATPAHISVFSGPGGESGLPRSDPFGNNRTSRATGRGGNARGGGRSPAPSEASTGKFHAVARWESARPIYSASKTRSDDASRFYIVALIGDLPDLAGSDDDDPSARQQRGQMMREATKLERKGESPLYLDHLQPVTGGDLFYFLRLEPIKPSNKELTFTTRLGPLEIKAKFSLKDMLYRGKLEL